VIGYIENMAVNGCGVQKMAQYANAFPALATSMTAKLMRSFRLNHFHLGCTTRLNTYGMRLYLVPKTVINIGGMKPQYLGFWFNKD